jgi:DNA-binding MarR family transcriptional regulator
MPTYAMSLLGRDAHDRMAETLQGGLRLGHLAVLAALVDEAPRTQRELAEQLRIHASDIVAIIDELIGQGLASRESDRRDRRRNLIRVTAAGRRLVRSATSDSRRISAELLAGLAPEERECLERLLLKALAPRDTQPVPLQPPGVVESASGTPRSRRGSASGNGSPRSG